MKNVLLFIVAALTLSGCMWQTADSSDLRKAEYFCKGVLNIAKIDIRFDSAEVIYCLDGTNEYASNVNIKETK
jgi:hypothetical protein